MKSSRRSPITYAAFAGLALLGSSCVSPGDPGINVVPLSADLVFGAKIEEPSAPTPNEAGLIDAGAIEAPTFPTPPPRRPRRTGPPIPSFDPGPPRAAACPEHFTQVSPREATEPFITGDPPVGLYNWKGTVAIGEPGAQTVEPLADEFRVVRRFTKNGETILFETVQPFGENFLISYFEVNSGGTQVRQPAGENVFVAPRAREPEAGVVLKKTQVVNGSGQNVGLPFEPSTGILLLPLEVVASESYSSVAVDPRTGRTVVHNAIVRSRERINVCGEPVDGWLVEANQNITEQGDQDPRDNGSGYHYLIAPQYGGILILERLEDFANEVIVTRQLGQVVPDPLPPGLA